MPNPVTHLLWGYLIARRATPEPRYIALGMLLAVVLDLDYLVPGVGHHGLVHTPVFALALTAVLWSLTRDRLVLALSVSVTMSHLLFDTIATQDPIMWLWPASTEGFALWTIDDLTALAVIKVYLLLIPILWMWETWKRTGESPVRVIHWIDRHIPRPVLYSTSVSAGVLLVFVWITEYMWMLTA